MICKKHPDGKCELLFPEDFKKECMRLYPRHDCNDWPFIWQENRIIDQDVADFCLNTLEKRLLANKDLDRWTVVAVYRSESPKKFNEWISKLEAKERLYRWFLELKEEQFCHLHNFCHCKHYKFIFSKIY